MPLPGAIYRQPPIDPHTGLFTEPWIKFFTNLMVGTTPAGGVAPADAEYLVGALNGVLTAERLVTNSTSNSWDLTIAGQAQVQRAALTGDVTAAANSNATTIPNDTVTYAKMQNVSAASRLLGRGSAAGAGDVEEISVGTGLAMTGTTLSASGGGTVTTTGSPASGNLTKFSGATSITNGDLSGDVTTAGTLVTTLANTAVTPGGYGSSTQVGTFTVNSKGLLTAAANVSITAGGIGASDPVQALMYAVAF